ncbi:hypothetical protein VNO77_18949 [Canavalia gladiata]|uniref:Uncharacterized protein n=1 Tax=Canavalia gladiata TaxID=3824 RepID=A0AAN9QK33_CANGL
MPRTVPPTTGLRNVHPACELYGVPSLVFIGCIAANVPYIYLVLNITQELGSRVIIFKAPWDYSSVTWPVTKPSSLLQAMILVVGQDILLTSSITV